MPKNAEQPEAPLAAANGGAPESLGRVAILWTIAVVVFMSGWGVFLYRGFVPGALIEGADFRIIYSSARAWVYGVNPYEADRLDQIWLAARGPSNERPTVRGSQDLLYPPSSFPLMAPFVVLDWPVARSLWAQANFVALAVSIWSLVYLLRLRWLSPVTWILVGAAIAFAPFHTGVKVGQTAMFVTASVIAGHALRLSGRPILGGVLIGIGAVLKPQVGLVFVAYEIFRWRWRVAGPALAALLLIAGLGIGRLWLSGVDWLPALQQNVANFTIGRGDGNPLSDNEHRFQMIDLRPVIHHFTDNRTLGALGAWGVAGLLGLATFLVWLRREEDRRELIALSIGGAASLLIVYHRFYDASMLLIPLGWAIWALGTPEGRRYGLARWAVLVGVLPYFVPGAAFLYQMMVRGHIRQGVWDNAMFQVFVLHHQSWALVWLVAAMIWALSRAPRRTAPALAWWPGAKRGGEVPASPSAERSGA